KYPETSRLFPDDYKTLIKINTKLLLQSIDRALLLARDAQNNVVKMVTSGQHYIEISSHSAEIGKVSEKITCDEVSGEEQNISFSEKYMMYALKAIESLDVEVYFTGSMRPFILHPPADKSALQLILPIRTY